MQQEQIFVPFLGMAVLTLVVWIYMYIQRLSYLRSEGIDPQSVSTTQEVERVTPIKVKLPSENLINLFELPVIFYALCLYIYVTGKVDGLYLYLAYAFLFLRIVHSVIHCSYNRVVHRFSVYILASLALWAMVIRAFAAATAF